ncbi:MAG: substrate-binding domain-containing protein, partial [Chloroflexota bacterium]|nr:substrate-binding domain-containing protein [Chloroflexota bacterium]
ACAETEDGSPALMQAKDRVQVATTTSLYDTGLWGHLEPMFEEEYDVELDIIYAGTGIALEYGKRGDVDAITIHSRSREDQFVADGYGVNRRCIAYNYFLIVGPEDDPAGIKDTEPPDAFIKLIEQGQADPDAVKFISRGDDSGTHGKEKTIWSEAGYDYNEVRDSGSWYVEAGKGMGPTLLMASEMNGYTLTDTGTFLAYKGDLNLVPVVDEGDILLNVYSAIAVNPEQHSKTDIEMANNLINFLMSEDIQDLIGEYGVEEYGMPLFYPCAQGNCQDIGCPTREECSNPAQ